MGGCFSITIQIASIINWKLRASFEINLHSKDLEILKRIQAFFGGIGKVYIRSDRPICVYRVTNVSDLLSVIIPHFSTYPFESKTGGFPIMGHCSKYDEPQGAFTT